MVTIGDLIIQGIIRQYIPPHKGGNSERVKKGVVLQNKSEVMQEVFQAWINCDIANKKSRPRRK